MAVAPFRPEIAAIVEQLDELRPTLMAGGREADSARRIPQDNFDAVAATGAFSISAPTAFGGLAANTAECHAVARAIGRGDGSIAWVHGILDSGAWVVSLMDERAQQDGWGTEKGLDSFI